MRKELFNKSFLEKKQYILNLIADRFKAYSEAEMRLMLCHISHYHYGKQKSLLDEERIVYKIFLEHDVNVGSAYKWFLMTIDDENMKLEIKDHKLTASQAYRINKNLREKKKLNLGFQIVQEARRIIRDKMFSYGR